MSNYPPFLLRFFDKENYARKFLEGEVRFGLLTYYKKIKGARRDDKEGEASFFWNKAAPQITIDLKSNQIIDRGESEQKIRYTGFSMNQRYILCTSHSEADIEGLKKEIGPFIVRIKQPEVLLGKIKEVWKTHPFSLNGSTKLKSAVYNGDDLLEPNPYLIAPSDYSYTQKSKLDEYQKNIDMY
ncbi:MAG: hypothetical protein AABZ21_05070 [Deltaproteobacteria bacterium]